MIASKTVYFSYNYRKADKDLNVRDHMGKLLLHVWMHVYKKQVSVGVWAMAKALW